MEEQETILRCNPVKEKTAHKGQEYTLFCIRDSETLAKLISKQLIDSGHKSFVEKFRTASKLTMYKVWWKL